MKKFFTLFVYLFAVALVAHGQEKVKETVEAKYDRNALSVIVVTHADQYDAQIVNTLKSVVGEGKFDINDIPTKTFAVNSPRNGQAPAIDNLVAQNNIGRQIISYIFDRQPNGTMTARIINERGAYNAKDQDVINAQSSKLGMSELENAGLGLVANSYLLVLDYTKIRLDKNFLGDTVRMSDVKANFYKIVYNEEVQNAVFDTWIDEGETDAQKTARNNEAYNNLNVKMNPVGSFTVTTSTPDETGWLPALVEGGYNKVITEVENRHDALKVKAAIISTRPLKAKIGSKEGVKNGSRYFAYKTVMNANGTTSSTRTGVVRATKVADNRYVATGKSDASEFLQIAGWSVRQGNVLRQHNDAGVGIGLGWRAGGLDGINLHVDYLADIKTSGLSQYGLLSVVANRYKCEPIAGVYDASNVFPLTMMIGYGIGYRFAKYFEIVPQIMIGYEMLLDDDQVAKDNETKEDTGAVAFQGGVKFYVNVAYPLQVYVGADYSGVWGSEEAPVNYKYIMNHIDKDRNGTAFTVGLKYTF